MGAEEGEGVAHRVWDIRASVTGGTLWDSPGMPEAICFPFPQHALVSSSFQKVGLVCLSLLPTGPWQDGCHSHVPHSAGSGVVLGPPPSRVWLRGHGVHPEPRVGIWVLGSLWSPPALSPLHPGTSGLGRRNFFPAPQSM